MNMNSDRNSRDFDPDANDGSADRWERLLDEADHRRDELKDRQMEEMWAKKEKGEL